MPCKTLNIIKIGGRVLDDELILQKLIKAVAKQRNSSIIIHGGGDQISQLSKKLGVQPQFIDGRRITDQKSLDLVTMVLAGLINKQLVAKLQSYSVNAMGLSGVDANIVLSEKRGTKQHDYGFVGNVKSVNVSVLINMLNNSLLPVLAALTHDGNGQLLNVNADTVAYEIAKDIAKISNYQVDLYYCMDLQGVYEDIENPESLIESLDYDSYQTLIKRGKVHQGMLVKLENCFNALEAKVHKVVISNAENITKALMGTKYQATTIQLTESVN